MEGLSVGMKGDAAGKAGRIRIWDSPVRLFHWSLVALLLFSWQTASTHEMEWHLLSGYCILALLVFRIYWGFFGSSTARFAQFVRGPRATIAYIRSIGRGAHAKAVGHNPLGAWSILVMLAILLAMVGTGLFSVDVDGLVSGPLSDYVEFDTGRDAAEMHAQIFNIILVVVAIHLLAILVYLAGRQNLVTPMITGGRRAEAGETSSFVKAPFWVAIVGFALAAFTAYAVAHNFWQ